MSRKQHLTAHLQLVHALGPVSVLILEAWKGRMVIEMLHLWWST